MVFSRGLLESTDIDPVYPILRETYTMLDLDNEQRLWFTYLYLAYHILPSAAAAFERHPYPEKLDKDILKLPLMMQRRNLRGGKLSRHVESYLQAIEGGTQDQWVRNGFTDDPAYNFEAFWLTSQNLWGNGRLSAYKWAEILWFANGYNLHAPDMRLDQCLGPRRGVELVYDLLGAPTWVLNIAGDDIKARLEEGLGRELRWAEVETVLCDFAALLQGRFYVGNDIDEIQEQIIESPAPKKPKEWLYEARRRAIPNEYLGELNGWKGRTDELRRSYREKGVIRSRCEVLAQRKAQTPRSVEQLMASKQKNRRQARKRPKKRSKR